MKTVLITGANRGIGLEHARRFAMQGIEVFAAVRDPEQAQELQALARAHKGRLTIVRYDAAQADAPAQVKQALDGRPVDLLLANAGASGDRSQTLGSLDMEDVLQLLRVNALAPLKLAEVLSDNVAGSQRKLIAIQSSQLGSIGNNHSGGRYAYRISKAALNMIARNLASDLGARGITVVALHPGWVKTRMGGAEAPIEVAQSVLNQQRLLERLTPADSGRFFNHDGTELPW